MHVYIKSVELLSNHIKCMYTLLVINIKLFGSFELCVNVTFTI